jgi:hypothetical protein
MKTGRKTWYEGALHIPEGKIGDFEIKHWIAPPKYKFETATFRTMLHAGHSRKIIRYPYPTQWHQLLENDNVWMQDIPLEQYQHDQLLRPFRKDVLVGGLGLGYAVTVLEQNWRVKNIVVVEKSQEVIDLVGPYIKNQKTTVIKEDIFNFLKDTKEYFNYAFYDTWHSDSETTLHTTVLPLHNLSTKRRVKKVVCWNEDVMRGQLFMNIRSRLFFLELQTTTKVDQAEFMKPTLEELATFVEGDPEVTVWRNWSVPYWKWYQVNSPDKRIAEQAALIYSQWYGLLPEKSIRNLLQWIK